MALTHQECRATKPYLGLPLVPKRTQGEPTAVSRKTTEPLPFHVCSPLVWRTHTRCLDEDGSFSSGLQVRMQGVEPWMCSCWCSRPTFVCWCIGKERVLIGIISTFTLCEEVHNIRALAEQIYTALTCLPRGFKPCLTGSSRWASTGWPPTFRVVTRKTCSVRVHFLAQCDNVYEWWWSVLPSEDLCNVTDRVFCVGPILSLWYQFHTNFTKISFRFFSCKSLQLELAHLSLHPKRRWIPKGWRLCKRINTVLTGNQWKSGETKVLRYDCHRPLSASLLATKLQAARCFFPLAAMFSSPLLHR